MDNELLRERAERIMTMACIWGGALMVMIALYQAVQPYILALLEISQESAAFFGLKITFGLSLITIGLYMWVSKKAQLLKETAKTLKQAADMRTRYKAELVAKDAEIESLRARVAELENAAQNGTEGEDVGLLKMHLEDSERARAGLSDELSIKTFELELVRQELEELKAVHGEGSKLRTMWRYVLELEARGMTDADIRNALIGDGFKNPAIDALLYPGKGANYSAVTKYFQRH